MIVNKKLVKSLVIKNRELFEAERDYHLPLRWTMIGLIHCCDQKGCFRWQPEALKEVILPYDKVHIHCILEALLKSGFIQKYEYEGRHYGCISAWPTRSTLLRRSTEPEPLPPLFSWEFESC